MTPPSLRLPSRRWTHGSIAKLMSRADPSHMMNSHTPGCELPKSLGDAAEPSGRG